MAGLNDLTQQQRDFNKLPYDKQQELINSTFTSSKPVLTAAKPTNNNMVTQSLPSVTAKQTVQASSNAGNPMAPYTQPTQSITPQPQQQQNTVTQATKPEFDYEAKLSQLKQAQIDAAIGKLTNTYNQKMADLKAKQSALPTQYGAKKLKSQSDSALQAKNFAEFLAARGQSRSGIAIQAEMNRTGQLQNTFNQYDAQQKADEDYYAQQQDAATTAYNQDTASAQAQASSDYLNNLIKTQIQQDEWRKQAELEQARLDEAARVKAMELRQSAWEKDQQRQADAIKNANDMKDKSVSRQLQMAGLTGDIPVELVLENMTPEQIAMYQNIPDYAEAKKNTSNPAQIAILDYFRNQKIMNSPELMDKYGNTMTGSYIPTRSALESDRKYNYDVNKDERDFNYTAGRDTVKDNQWMNDFGLKSWVAEDNSKRGWDSNSISRQNADTNAAQAADASARGWANIQLSAQRQAGESNKDYAKRIDNELQNVENDYFKQVGDSQTYLAPNKEGSAERRELFNRLAMVLANSDLTPQQKDERLTGKFSKWEIETWMK